MKEIILTKGKVALVDDEDYERINAFKWFVTGTGYAGRMEKRKMLYMHREILHPEEKIDVDHANRNKLDNRKENIRLATRGQNLSNRESKPGSRSRFKGVYWSSAAKRWKVAIQAKKENIHIGLFDTEEEAARAYNTAALQYHGAFARLNNL